MCNWVRITFSKRRMPAVAEANGVRSSETKLETGKSEKNGRSVDDATRDKGISGARTDILCDGTWWFMPNACR